MRANLLKVFFVLLLFTILIKQLPLLIKSYNVVDEELPPTVYEVITSNIYSNKTVCKGKEILWAAGYEYNGIPYIVTVEAGRIPEYCTGSANVSLIVYNVRGEELNKYLFLSQTDISPIRLFLYRDKENNTVIIVSYKARDVNNPDIVYLYVRYFIVKGYNITETKEIIVEKINTTEIPHHYINMPIPFVYVGKNYLLTYSIYTTPTYEHFLKIYEITNNSKREIVSVKLVNPYYGFSIVETKNYIYMMYLSEVQARKLEIIAIDKRTDIYQVIFSKEARDQFGVIPLAIEYENDTVLTYHTRYDPTTQTFRWRYLLIRGLDIIEEKHTDQISPTTVMLTRTAFLEGNKIYAVIGDKRPSLEILEYTIDPDTNEMSISHITTIGDFYNVFLLLNVTAEEYRFGIDRVPPFAYKVLGAKRDYITSVLFTHFGRYNQTQIAYISETKTGVWLLSILLNQTTILRDLDNIFVVDGYYVYYRYPNNTYYVEAFTKYPIRYESTVISNNFIVLIKEVDYYSKGNITEGRFVAEDYEYNVTDRIFIFSVVPPEELPYVSPPIVEQPQPTPQPQPQPTPAPSPGVRYTPPPEEVVQPTPQIVQQIENITEVEEVPPGAQVTVPITGRNLIVIIAIIILLVLLYFITRKE